VELEWARGRKRLQPEVPLEATQDFATRVLYRVGRDKNWLTYADVSKVKSDEDLALHLLANDATRYQTLHKLLDRKYGKPSPMLQHAAQVARAQSRRT
jgi:hypothetical protein